MGIFRTSSILACVQLCAAPLVAQVPDSVWVRPDTSVLSASSDPFGDARWIYAGFGGGHASEAIAAPVFRKAFQVEKPVERAQLAITGLGYFECLLDGKPITDAVLMPGQTQYDLRWRYRVFDLGRLEAGRHIISIEVGDGFYNATTRDVWNFDHAPWRGAPKTICRLYDADTGEDIVRTDSSWKVRVAKPERIDGRLVFTPRTPLVFNSVRGGETYDARMEFPWDEVDGPDWIPIYVAQSPGGVGEEETFEPCRVLKVHEMALLPGPNRIYKAPVNLAGGVRLTVKGARGAKVTLRFAEVLKDGHVWQDPISCFVEKDLQPEEKTFQRDIYILKGGEAETWRTKFTYHGYQYCEATVEGEAEILKLEALEIHNDVRRIGRVATSDARINRVLACCEQSILSNLQNIPTDCPQREKNGWLGDANLRMEASLYAFDMTRIYENAFRLACDTQRPGGEFAGIFPCTGWGYTYSGSYSAAAILEMADTMYRFTGSTALRDEAYRRMPRWIDQMQRMRDERGVPQIGLWDWLHPLSCDRLDWQYVRLVGYARSLLLQPGAEKEYAEAKANLEKLFFRDGLPVFTNSAACAMALDAGVIAPEKRAAAAARVAEILRGRRHRVDFGMNGCYKVMRTLGDFGYADDLFELMTQSEKPGWIYWTDTLGLTTLPERWDIDENTERDGSYCHGAYTEYMACVYRYFAGFRYTPEHRGGDGLEIRPIFPKKLGGVEAEHRGYRVKWNRTDGGISFVLTVPEGRTATLTLPGRVPREVGAGTYQEVVP